jgi:hypothetical protein
MPIERAEPKIICIAASTLFAFKSFIFASAISRTCVAVTEPTVWRPGALAPDFNFAAF